MGARTFDTIFATELGPAERVLEFKYENRVGRPAEAFIDVHLAEYQDPDEVIGKGGVLSFGYEGDPFHVFKGVVENVTVMASMSDGPVPVHHFRFHVVAPIALLARVETCEIFQELDVREIVTKACESRGHGESLEWKLTGSYVKREYCVQYNESVLDFITRLCEDEGIWFVTDTSPDGEKTLVTFADDSSSAPPIEGAEEIPFRPRAGFDQLEDAIGEISLRRRVVPGKFVLRDYNFKKPSLDLTSEAQADKDTDLEIYDFPGGYLESAEGKRRAKIRLEAAQAERRTVQIVADCTRIRAGQLMSIAESGDIGADGKYFVTSVTHHYKHATRLKGVAGGGFGADGGGGVYHCDATLLASDVKYRLPVVTPKPLIEGPQTATVVAPAGSPQEEIHTDEHGRAKVKFHWDLAGIGDDKASCWMRVGQLQTSGSMHLPRIGWEVVVQFLEGDPDRPVVTGKLYNGLYMPPYALPEGRTRTAIQSLSTPGGGGMNEIRIEDKAGGEEIAINAQYDTNINVANNKTKTVHGNESQSVGVDAECKVGANHTVKISQGNQRDVKSDQSLTVGGNRKLDVNAVTGVTTGGSSTTTVGGNHFEMNGNPLEGLIAVAVEKVLMAAAGKAMAKAQAVAGAALGKINQAMGPVSAAVGKAQALSSGVQAVANGNLGAAAGVMAGAAGVPGAGALAGAVGGGGAPAGGAAAGGGGGAAAGGGAAGAGGAAGGAPAGGGLLAGLPQGLVNAGRTVVSGAVSTAVGGVVQKGVRKAAAKLEGGGGGDAAGGGGESSANAAGPEGKVDGVNATDREKGPGHSINKITGSLTETVGAMKILATLNDITTNVGAAMTQNVGAAKVQLYIGNVSEAVAAAKTETEVGLVVVAKGDETESAGAMKTEMVGGAIAEKIGGNHTIVAGGMATFIGALHKIDAKSKITFKCGGSTVVVDGSGITIQSALVSITAAKIQIPKATTEL